MKHSIGLVICTFFSTSILTQTVMDNLERWHDNFPQEKLYLHTNKSVYHQGDELWFALYSVDARDHLPFTLSKLGYVELLDAQGSLVERRNVRIVDGRGEGDIILASDLDAGIYNLRAYTQYMCNYDSSFHYQRQLQILPSDTSAAEIRSAERATSVLDKIDFYPEGGDLIGGLPMKVGFIATDSSGKPVRAEGEVFDHNGTSLGLLKTQKNGLGFFNLTATAGQIASVKINDGDKTFQLPRAQNSGYSLQLNTRKKGIIQVKLACTPDLTLDNTYLLSHQRGRIYSNNNGFTGTSSNLALPEQDLTAGILHFTLFANNRPVCERLVFIHPRADTSLAISHSETYGLRQKINVGISALPDADMQDSAWISVSVSNDRLSPIPENYQNIQSYLWLESDLTRRIYDPSYYLGNSGQARFLTDLLMLTYGWRRFVWNDILENKEPDLNLAPEDGFDLSGFVSKKRDGSKPIKSSMILSAISGTFLASSYTTDENGKFLFTGLDLTDTTDIRIQAAEYDEKKISKQGPEGTFNLVGNRNVHIQLDQRAFPALALNNLTPTPDLNTNALSESISSARQKSVLDSMYRNIWSIDLDAVQITAKRKDKEFYRRAGVLYGRPSNRIAIDSIKGVLPYTNVFEFIRGRFPGVEVRGSFPNFSAVIRGSSSITLSNNALILVDGTQVSDVTASTIPFETVAAVEIVRGLSATATYGAAAANGIISIFTRQAGDGPPPPRAVEQGVIQIELPGYYKIREFASPDYSSPDPDHQQPDYRFNLFWKANIGIGKSGVIDLPFYAGDITGPYKIDIQGITDLGHPISIKKEFRID